MNRGVGEVCKRQVVVVKKFNEEDGIEKTKGVYITEGDDMFG